MTAREIPLNPAQQKVSDLLRSPGQPRPTFPAELGERLRAGLEERLAPIAAELPDTLFVGKYPLGAVHGCEAKFLALDGRPFELTAALAAGTAAHKAIQYSQHWPAPADPQLLVDEAIGRLVADGDRTGGWFTEASRAEHAEARTVAVDRVTKFLECFPPLRRAWLPVVESGLRAELAGGRIVLSGRVDLILGRANGLQAGKAFIDVKTGGSYGGHADDLRFYALLEVLRLGVPPFRVATCYLDQGRLVGEDVTEALLEAAAERVADGVEKLVELRQGGREPLPRPGGGCRRCPLAEGCEPGRSFLADAADREGLA